ncbi:hypothetical protein GGR92_005294 [Spirosoma lacussanchae]|uniref:glycosyltransferase family 61 protein n=1 Tax=Spirosoma lacussanchae TaxID=1884249 RepID=UPI003D1B4930
MHLSTVKTFAKQFFTWIAKRFGVTFLTKDETIVYLRPYQKGFHAANLLPLPEVTDTTDAAKVIFGSKTAVSEPSYTWVYRPDDRETSQLRCGNILTDGLVLSPDYGNQYLLKDSLKPDRRQTRKVHTLVAPFGHYQDGVAFGGYYDYIFLVAAKLCRMEQNLPSGSFADAAVSYPLFSTTYEREFLTYVGFSPEQILDSRSVNVQFDTCLMGNNGHWFYPNEANVQAIRQRLFPLIQNPTSKRERLYISRAGRRRIANKDALVKLLQQYDFTIVEVKPRSLSEQLSLYNRASLIVGPHGASFSNIIWCEPGTHLFELFSPNYAPDHFLYLSKLMGLTYSAYCQGAKQYTSVWIKRNSLSENITVSVSDIERSLNRHFEQYPAKATPFETHRG